MKSYGEWIDEKSEEPFQYPKAGKKAPPGVKMEIKSYQKLPPEEKAETPLLWWLLGSTTQDYKMSKQDALYTEKSETDSEKCGNCKYAYMHLASGIKICSVMRGQIKEEAWCRLWEKES